MISEIFKSKVGVIIVSIIWGLGLSTLFRKACQGRNCQVINYQGPSPHEINGSYYDYGNGQCYQYFPSVTTCST